MNPRKPWWWWTALAGTALVIVSIALSFRWIIGWTDSAYRIFLYFEHGMLCCNPNVPPPGASAVALPWYGAFELYRSSVYEPWRILPRIDVSIPGQWSVKVPLHVSLLVLLPIVVYPILPSVVRRNRQKRALCGNCAYDLTGNESGVCPECAKAMEVPRRGSEAMHGLLLWLVGASPKTTAARFGTIHLAIWLMVLSPIAKALGDWPYVVVWIVDFPLVLCMAMFSASGDTWHVLQLREVVLIVLGTVMWGLLGVFVRHRWRARLVQS
ncbi:MAG: hypothetical protein JSV78_13995 [Phycisphaerales bacterium]|nr:MAG: hypothetical protein JSV78_13995 [Phycisphaerales bacterium]